MDERMRQTINGGHPGGQVSLAQPFDLDKRLRADSRRQAFYVIAGLITGAATILLFLF